MPGPPRTWSAAIPSAGKTLTDARSSSWPGLSWEAWLLARAGREAPAAPGGAPTTGATGASPGWSLGQPTAPGSAPAAPRCRPNCWRHRGFAWLVSRAQPTAPGSAPATRRLPDLGPPTPCLSLSFFRAEVIESQLVEPGARSLG